MKFSGCFPCSKKLFSTNCASDFDEFDDFCVLPSGKHDLFWIHGQLFVLNAEPKNTMQWSYQNEHDDPMALGRKKTVKPVETADDLFPSAYELWKPFASHRCVCFSRWKIQWFLSCCWFCKAKKRPLIFKGKTEKDRQWQIFCSLLYMAGTRGLWKPQTHLFQHGIQIHMDWKLWFPAAHFHICLNIDS